MAITQLIEKQYEVLDPSKNYSFDDLFIINGGNRVYLKSLKISFGPSKSANLKTLQEFNNLKTKTGNATVGNPRLATSSGVVLSTIDGPYVNKLSVPKYHESTTIMSSALSPVGYKKYLETQETPTLENNAFFLVNVQNSKQEHFLRLNQIFYYQGATRKSVEVPAGKTLKEVIKDKDLFTEDGKVITSMYVEKTYRFKQCEYDKRKENGTIEKVAAAETFNASTLTKNSYSVSIRPDGTPEFKEEAIKVNNQVITHENSTIVEDAGKNDGTTTTVSAIAVKEFNISTSENAKYINIVLENQTLPKMVSVEDIYLEDKTTNVDNLLNCVGKAVYVKVDESFYKTEPLTLDQVTVKYEARNFYQRSLDTDDILADNSYLLMEDGTHQKEQDVAHPMYYAFVADNETNFDAYIATVTDSSGNEVQIIIDKSAYEEVYKKNLSSSFVLDGYTIEVAKVHKAKRTHDFNLCDAVQTTSKGKNIEFCKIYAAEEKTEEEKETQQEAFENTYKQGEYKLNKVFVNAEDGTKKLVDVDDRYERFILSDSYKLKNYADATTEYAALNEKPFKYVSEDGELGKITGGPEYDVGKAISKAYKTYGSLVLKGWISCLACPLAAFALFPVVAVGIVGAVVAPIAIPIVQLIKGRQNNINNYLKKNQSKINEKKWQKDFVKDLEHIYIDTKTNEKRNETKFLNVCEQIDGMINALKQANVYAGFELLNGEVSINSSNCQSVCKFMKEAEVENNLLKTGKISRAETRRLNKTIKELSKKENLTTQEELELKRAQELLDIQPKIKQYLDLSKKKASNLTDKEKEEFAELEIIYNEQKASFTSKMSHHKSEGYTTSPNKKSEQLIENANTTKAFLYTKYFMAEEELTTFVEAELGLTTEEEKTAKITELKEMLNGLDYDFENNLFKHGNDRYSYKTCAENDAHMYGMGPSQQQIQTTKTLKLIKKLMESDIVKSKLHIQTEAQINVSEEVEDLIAEEIEVAPELESELAVEDGVSLDPTTEEDVEAEPVLVAHATEDKPKKTRTRLNKVIITSENAVAQQLEDADSKYYKDAIRNLTRKNGKFKMSEEDAVATIFDFTIKVNEAHESKQYAKDVFEKGSVEAYILSNITKSMAKAATLDYLPKEKKNLSI